MGQRRFDKQKLHLTLTSDMDASRLLLVSSNMAHCDAVEWGHPLHQVKAGTL
jgi:hypothetical protein